MTVTDGFFNSVSGDRLYDANHFNTIFDGIIVDGVLQGWGDALIVSESTGMNVLIGSGKAWFNDSWLINDADTVLQISESHPTLIRYDRVVLDFNKRDEVRENDIIVIDGTPGLPAATEEPVPIEVEEDHLQILVAVIEVEAGVTSITNANIDNKVGTTYCPFATGLLEQLDAMLLFNQWDSQFYDWFNDLQNELDENQVTNLQAQITDLNERRYRRNILINGDMQIAQRGFYTAPTATFSGYADAPDRWYFEHADAGSLAVLQNQAESTYWTYRVSVGTGSGGPPVAGAKTYVEQRIEGFELYELRKGFSDAKKMMLSFLADTNVSGTYVVEIIDEMNNRHVAKTYTVTGSGKTAYSIEIPKDVALQLLLDNTHALTVRFWLSAGSIYTSGVLADDWATAVDANRAVGQTYFGETTSNFFEFSKVQLEVGDTATPFEYMHHNDVLTLCQRYYEYDYRRVSAVACASPETIFDTMVEIHVGNYLVPKRDDPTLSLPFVRVIDDGLARTPDHLSQVGLDNGKRGLTLQGDDAAFVLYRAYRAIVEYIADSEL